MLITNKKLQTALLLLIILNVSGCRMLLHQPKPDFFAGNSAETAAQAVKSRVGSSFRVQEIDITDETFTMKIESPANPQNIDEYRYIGVAAIGPKAIKFDAYTAKTRERIPIEDIDFTVVPQIARKALEKMQIEKGEVTRMTLGGDVGKNIRWRIEIQGVRENAAAWADMAGNITGTDLSQTSRGADYKVLSEAELNKAAAAINAGLGENARFSDIIIRENSVELKVINSENSKMVDLYNFGIDGLKKTPMPLIPANSIFKPFSLNEINLPDAANLAPKAKQRLDMPGGQLSNISINKDDSGIIWRISVNQGANSGMVSYDAGLIEISMRKN